MARRKKTSRRGRKSSSFEKALLRLKKLKSSDQHHAMSMANNAFIRQFCKRLKTLKHAKLSPKNRRVLKKHKKQLRQLINPRIGISKRRQLLSQKGSGFLRTALKFVPIVGPILDFIDSR
jgi:hypothetical protein